MKQEQKGVFIMTKTKITYVLAVLGLVLSLNACGKVSSPVPLEGSGYPHTYPQH